MKKLRFLLVRSMLIVLALLVGFAASVGAAPPAAAPEAESDRIAAQKDIAVEVFIRKGCPHCEKAKSFLTALAAERPEMRILLRDVGQDAAALERLRELANAQGISKPGVPAFYINQRLMIGFSDEANAGKQLLSALADAKRPQPATPPESCTVDQTQVCEKPSEPAGFEVSLFGHTLGLDRTGLPLFTLAMGLLDGFNPCSMWVLILMISLLAPMRDRWRMFAVAGTFIAVEGLAYLVFMAAWLNLFLLAGFSRVSQLIIAALAIGAGAIHIKDGLAFGHGISLSIPQQSKPGIYAQIRRILQAENLLGALLAAAALAVLVQIVEFLCTSGFPALYTRILTLQQLGPWSYYGYLLLYNAAYMFDDALVLGVGIFTLSQRRLQEKEGRWLKLISGGVMIILGVYLLAARHSG
ncbi:NrdH-redoxin [Methylomicrobium sp. RS1]|nr:NrdH-redoxin [Methylomicrobium sp. RS1]